MIKVLSLSHVPGYKSVYKANKVLEIPLDQSKKFYYRIPAFLLTDEQDGRLRGMWELDLTEFPVSFGDYEPNAVNGGGRAFLTHMTAPNLSIAAHRGGATEGAGWARAPYLKKL
ncbi:hypothetical protein Tco_1537272 [Tanacetum coccineum]